MPLKLVISKKVVQYFRHGVNIQCDREIFPPVKLHFFAHNISKNRHMKYNISKLLHDSDIYASVMTTLRLSF